MTALRRTTLTVSALSALAAPMLVAGLMAAPAVADDDDENTNNGSCSGSTVWKMKAKEDDGRIEVEAEIDSNRNGQTWNWKLKENGDVVAKGASQTKGPSGSFEVERKRSDRAGTDRFVFRAVNGKSGEVCRATVSW